MDLQEVLRKQKERGFKKPLAAASNTLSINDYLSDPHASRPYIDDVSASKTLSVVKNTNENIHAAEVEAKTKPAIITETAKVTDVKNIEVELSAILAISEPEKIPAITTPEPIEIVSVKQQVISDKKATQEFRSATQQLASATQELYSENTKATQEFRSATQTATQQLRKNYSKAGRPKIECFDYTKLVGNELKLTNEIYTECLKSKSFETGYIEKHEFSQRVKVKSGAIRTSCTRLKSKDILEDFIATKGRGSAWKFVLSENIFHQISMKNTLKLSAISDTISDTKILSSSSDINNKNTTTQLPADWKKIEYAELQKTLNIFNERFGLAQIKTVFAEAGDLITSEDVQTSIHNFTIGLNNYIQKPSSGIYDRKVKIATLLESLKNGEVFIDPQVEALKEAQAKKIAAELRAEMAAQYFEPKFEYYFASLSDEQAIALIPTAWKNSNTAWEHAVKTNNVIVQKSYAKDFAKEYFEKNIWQDILKDLLKI